MKRSIRSQSIVATLLLPCACVLPTSLGEDEPAELSESAGSAESSESSESSGEAESSTTSFDDESGTTESSKLDPFDCGAVMTQSAYCLTHEGSALMFQGLDDGAVCTLTAYPPGSVGLATTLALFDDSVVQCVADEVRIFTISTQSLDATGIPCVSLARYDDGVVVLPSVWDSPIEFVQTVITYASVDDLREHVIDEIHPIDDLYASRIAMSEDTIYAAWHSTDRIHRFDLHSGEDLGDIVLEGHDGWILGMSVVDETIYVRSSFVDDEWKRFDTQGNLLGTGPMLVGGEVLECVES